MRYLNSKPTRLILLIPFIWMCSSPQTEQEANKIDSIPTEQSAPLSEVTITEAQFVVTNDNPEIIGTWISPHLSNTDFGYRIDLTEEKYLASYSGNFNQSPDMEGSWSFQNSVLVLIHGNDSILFTIKNIHDDSLVIESAEFRVGNSVCRGQTREGKIQSIWYRDEGADFSQSSLTGAWGSIDGELSFLEDGTYNECCAGGTWKVDVKNGGVDLHETWMDAEADLKDRFWNINTISRYQVYINHQSENPEYNFDHLYFRKLERKETPYILPIIIIRDMESDEKFIDLCSVIVCG